MSLGDCTTSITVTPPGAESTGTLCKRKYVALTNLESYGKFHAEFGQNLIPSVFTLSSASNGTTSHNIVKLNPKRNYAAIGPTSELRPSLPKASRPTAADMLKKPEPRLKLENRYGSKQKFNCNLRLVRLRNLSDPCPESADTSSERSANSKQASTLNLVDHSNACPNSSYLQRTTNTAKLIKIAESIKESSVGELIKKLCKLNFSTVENLFSDKSNLETEVPSYCVCQNCTIMPSAIENVCCGEKVCVTKTVEFAEICLNELVLKTAMAQRNDLWCTDDDVSSNNFRHYAYRQFIYWKYGHLGKGNRRVCPSCSVQRIRRDFPSESGQYTGFKEN